MILNIKNQAKENANAFRVYLDVSGQLGIPQAPDVKLSVPWDE